MEHLFMQIFDRKAWIEGQLKHQIQSYGESVACDLLAGGKRPPPWLWSEGLGNFNFPDPKEKTTSHLGPNRSKDEHTDQPTQSRASLVDADILKELSAMSDSLHLPMDGCRFTRSRSRVLSNNHHLRKLSGHREATNCVKNDEYKAAESKSDYHNLIVSHACSTGAAACPHSCLEMSSAVDSILPDSLPLVEPNKLRFDCPEEFYVTKNSPNPSEKENHGFTGMSLSEWDVVHSAEDVLPCGDLEKLNGSEDGISQCRKPDRDKVFNGVVEYEQEYVELDDSGHHSHLLSGTSQGQQSVHLDVCSRSSLDYLVNQAVEDQCSIQLEEVLKCGVACMPFVANTSIEPKYFEIHNNRECGLNIGLADALERETKASYSANDTEMEVWQSYRVSSGSDTNQAQSPPVDWQLHKYDGLPTVMSYMEKANKVSCQALETGKLSEVLESESVSHHMSKLLHGPAMVSSRILCGSSKSAPCSSSVTDLMLNSDVEFFSHRSAKLDASKRQSFRDSVKHKIEVQQTEHLTKGTKGTDGDHLQLMKPTHNDIFSEAGETEASVGETVKISAMKSIWTTTPMDAGSSFKILVVGDSSTNSIDNSEIFGSCKSVGPVVPSNEAANCLLAQGNVANRSITNAELSTTGKRSYTSATHSAQPTTCYFLRSSTSQEKSPRSPQGNSSVCYFRKDSKYLETNGNETCSGPEDVTEKSVNYHKITPDITRTHNELLKARYLLRSLDSHDDASSRVTQSMKTIADTCEATWPKRRKTVNTSSNVHGTSPRVRIKHFLHNQEGSTGKCNIKGTADMGSKLIQSSTETDIGICDTALANSLELLYQNKNCCTMERCPCIGEDDQALVAPLPVECAQEETFSDLGCGILLKDGARAPELINCELQKLYTSDDGHDSMLVQNTQEHEIQRSPSNSERFFKEKENSDVDLCLHMHDTTQFADCNDDSVGFDETIPELEGFTIGIPSVTENRCSDFQSLQKERDFVLEQLCRTRNIPTPLSKLSSKYRINEIPDVGQSLPSGILERMHLSCALQFSDADMEHFRGSNYGNLADFHSNLGADINGNFAERPYSHSLPSSTTRNYYEGAKPPLSPRVMKFSQKVVSGTSGASSEKVGSNPELICFRIDENSPIANENEHIDRSESSEEDLVLKGIQNSANRKALFDVTQKYQNAPKMVSDSKKFQDRGSLESVNSESYFGAQVSSHLSLGNGHASNTQFKIEDKGNGDHSVYNRLRKAALSVLNRSGKRCVSEKTNKRVRSQSNSGKECKPNNIISSLSSFIPSVRSKQKAASPLKGKREIKVKALEIAEAAKRLEEKKHNEREMRKVAAKLEKERLEQEKIRLLEVEKKQKEEEKMKKEADIAARKRQREEEGKKEKERKRRRVEETRRQHKEQEERSRAIKVEKDIRQKASDDKEQIQKEMDLEAKQQLKTQKNGVDGCREGTDVQSKAMKLLAVATSSGNNTLEAVDDPNKPNDIVKVASNSDGFQGARKEKIYIPEINQDLLSYEISPYIDSADEDDEDGIRRKHKQVPHWARRERLEQIIFSQQFLDPKKIFCRKLSFRLTEVLSTRTRRPV